MIRVKNPYSRKRNDFKRKKNIALTHIFSKKVEWFQTSSCMKSIIKKIRGERELPYFLTSAIQTLKSNKNFKLFESSNSKDVELELLEIYMAEYIPTDDIESLKRGLKNLIREYGIYGKDLDIKRVDSFCQAVEQNLRGGAWSDFGVLNFEKNKKINKYVKSINISLNHLSPSSIVIEFIILPSKTFISEYQKIINQDVKSEIIFDFRLKDLFRFWGMSQLSSHIVKNQKREDYIIELKWLLLKELESYLDLFFTNNHLLAPSIELYKVNRILGEDNIDINFPWESIGINSSFSDASIDKQFMFSSFFKDEYNISESSKLLYKFKTGTENSSDNKISKYRVRDFAAIVLPILTLRKYAQAASVQVSTLEKKYFYSNKRNEVTYKDLIKIRFELEKKLQQLRRFKNEISNNFFEATNFNLKKSFEFVPTQFSILNEASIEKIINDTKDLLEDTYEHAQIFSKIMDDNVRLLELSTNNSLRKRTFLLTILAVFLSFVATVLAAMALDKGKQVLLMDKIENVVRYLF